MYKKISHIRLCLNKKKKKRKWCVITDAKKTTAILGHEVVSYVIETFRTIHISNEQKEKKQNGTKLQNLLRAKTPQKDINAL